MVGRRRAVLICHPDFDKPGKAGIQSAKNFAEQYLLGQKQMIALAEKNGEDPGDIAKIRAYTNAFRFLIRNLDEDLL